MSRGAHDEEGQAIVIAVFFMIVLLGFCALTLDIGHAYLIKRRLQAAADAAALAGAQALPDVTQASALASAYGPSGANVPGDGRAVQMAFSTKCLASVPGCSPANAVVVRATAEVPMVFGGLFGVSNLTVHATRDSMLPVRRETARCDARPRSDGLDVHRLERQPGSGVHRLEQRT